MNLENVTRVEVIDHTKEDRGRMYMFWNKYDPGDKPDPKVSYQLQDDGKTLKIFIA